MKSAGLLQPSPNGEPIGKDCPRRAAGADFRFPCSPSLRSDFRSGGNRTATAFPNSAANNPPRRWVPNNHSAIVETRTKPKKRIALRQSTPSGPARRLLAYRLPQMLKKSMKTAAATAFNPLSPLAHNRSRRCGSAAGLLQTAEPPIRRRFSAKRRSKSGMVCAYLRFTSRVFDIFPIHNFHFNNICNSY